MRRFSITVFKKRTKESVPVGSVRINMKNYEIKIVNEMSTDSGISEKLLKSVSIFLFIFSGSREEKRR